MLVSVGLVAGCATSITPSDLAVPKQITCVYLSQPLTASGVYGIGYTWITRLERGPYFSEREDDKGSYYRAPPGGYSLKGLKGEPFPGLTTTMDGGFFLPNDPNEPPRLYAYFSTEPAPVLVPPEDADCSMVGYTKDPATSRVSMLSFAAGGAVGGAAGGIVGRSLANGSHMSYGQAAGVGAAGGLIGGLIVAAIINSGVGKIHSGLLVKDPVFLKQLRELGANKLPVKEIPLSAVPADTSSVESKPVQ